MTAVADRTFEYEGVRIRVECEDASHSEWLEEFLSPQFAVGEGGVLNHTVSLVIDARAFGNVFEVGPSGAVAAAFILDQGIRSLPVWNQPEWDRSDANRRIVYDDSSEVFYCIDGSNIAVLSHGNRPGLRVALMRVVRELAMSYARGLGALFLHASCFSLDGNAVIIAGPKRAGKTSVLLYALQNAPVNYVTNDRLMVRPYRDRIVVKGIPSIVSIRSGTLELFPRLRDRITSKGYYFRSTLGELTSATPRNASGPADGSRALAPAQLCAAVGRQAAAVAAPKVILFPRIVAGNGCMTPVPLSKADALQALTDALFAASHPTAGSELFSPDNAIRYDHNRLHACCRALVASVGCYECTLDADTYQSPAGINAVLERLL